MIAGGSLRRPIAPRWRPVGEAASDPYLRKEEGKRNEGGRRKEEVRRKEKGGVQMKEEEG